MSRVNLHLLGPSGNPHPDVHFVTLKEEHFYGLFKLLGLLQRHFKLKGLAQSRAAKLTLL